MCVFWGEDCRTEGKSVSVCVGVQQKNGNKTTNNERFAFVCFGLLVFSIFLFVFDMCFVLFLFLRATSLIGIGLLFQRLCDLLPDVVEGIGAGVVDLSGFPALAAH